MEGVSSNGRPVWKHSKDSDTYFFFTSHSYWMVGPDYEKAGGWLGRDGSGMEEIPRTNWRWRADMESDKWINDPTLTVEGLIVLLMS